MSVRTPFYLSPKDPNADIKDGEKPNLLVTGEPFQCLRYMSQISEKEYSDRDGKLFIIPKRDAYDMPVCASITKAKSLICFPYFAKRDDQIHRIAIVGKSGSGKSFTIGFVLDQLINNKPKPYDEDSYEFIDNPTRGRIVIFSGVGDDAPLDRERREQKPIRIDINSEGLLRMEPSNFQDCIVVFDDIEKLLNVKASKYILKLRAMMMEVSRHYKCDIITVSHNILGGQINAAVKNELTCLFLYPDYNQNHTSNEFLKKYAGFHKDTIATKIMNHASRWVFINLTTPNYVIHEKGIELLN